jgi:tRNA/rRNA methyltransferase
LNVAGTAREQTLITDGPAVILVEPQLGENIGMVARAMANFGLSELRLVKPRDIWPNPKATATASGAVHVIEATRVFETLREAIEDRNYVVATTARARDGYKPVRGPVEAGRILRRRFVGGEKTAIVFGRERFGLDNEEVGLADEIVTFPVNPAFASLNIAQAVLLMSYEWMKSGLEDETQTPFTGPELVPAEKAVLHSMFEHLEEALDARGYFRPPEKKHKMVDSLRAVLTRPAFTEAEIRVLRGIISSLDYFSPATPRGSGAPEGKRRVPDRDAEPKDANG